MNNKTIILVSGKMRSGKDTATAYIKQKLEKDFKVSHKSFAYKLKDVCINDFKILYERLHSLRDELLPMIQNHHAQEIIEKELTFSEDCFYDNKNIISRSLMEIVGTELREQFVEMITSLNQVSVSESDKEAIKAKFWSLMTEKTISKEDDDIVIISDWRFPQEKDAFENYKVVTIRMDRTFDDQHEEYDNPHISEIALDEYIGFDYVVEKQRDIEDLYKLLDGIVEEVKP